MARLLRLRYNTGTPGTGTLEATGVKNPSHEDGTNIHHLFAADKFDSKRRPLGAPSLFRKEEIALIIDMPWYINTSNKIRRGPNTLWT